MARRGRGLEKLVCALESAWAESEKVGVESPMMLRDKHTGRLREHDVGLRIKQGHHEVIVAIECRDRSRPVDVKQVEHFHDKCTGTGVNSGAIVSTSGFAETARIKAEAYNIRCLDIAEAEAYDWLTPGEMLVRDCKLINLRLTVVPTRAEPIRNMTGAEFVDTDGARFGQEDFFRMMRGYLLPHTNKMLEGISTAGEHAGRVDFNTPGLKIILPDGEREVEKVCCEFLYKVDITAAPYSLNTYTDEKKGITISETASAPIQCDTVRGKVVMSRNDDGCVKVLFVKDD